jgi:photosystem II stability/assembly factor-like uncharacterized protein
VSSDQGLPAEADIRAIAMDPTNPARLLTGERTTGVWESVDGGAHWSQRKVGMESDLFVLCLAIDPANPLNAFAGTNNGHLYRTVNGAGSWAPSQSGLPNGLGATSILIDPSSSFRMWAGTSHGIFRSADRGATWTPTVSDFSQIISIALTAPGAQTLLAVSFREGPFRSTDGGGHWNPVAAGLSGHASRPLLSDRRPRLPDD